jgi:hypothetical protein
MMLTPGCEGRLIVEVNRKKYCRLSAYLQLNTHAIKACMIQVSQPIFRNFSTKSKLTARTFDELLKHATPDEELGVLR